MVDEQHNQNKLLNRCLVPILTKRCADESSKIADASMWFLYNLKMTSDGENAK